MFPKFTYITIPLYGIFRIRGLRNKKDLERKKIRLIRSITDYNSPIGYAIKTGNNGNLETLCQYFSNNKVEYRFGKSAFRYEILVENYIAVKNLIKHGQNVNEIDANGFTPIHYAIKSAHKNDDGKIVKILLDNGASLNHLDKDGFSPFFIALSYGNTNIIQLLIDRGSSVNTKIENINTVPLEFASKYWSVDIVKLLLSNGANIKSDFNRHTPLWYANQRTDKMKGPVIEVLEKWSFTMLIAIFQELYLYSYLDISSMIDFNDFLKLE